MRCLLPLLAVSLALPGLADETKTPDRKTPDRKTLVAQVIASTTVGDPGIKRPTAIAMAPGDVLLIGDDAGKQVLAFELPRPATPGPKIQQVANLGRKLLEKFGGQRPIVRQMVTTAAGDVAYFLSANYHTRKMTIVAVDAAGTLTELDLAKIPHAKVALPVVAHQRRAGIDDIGWVDGQIVVTGSTNAQFDADIISVPAPLGKAQPQATRAETYHLTHGAWETRAPVRRFCTHTQGAKTYLIGGYVCTPIVRFDLSGLTAGGKLRGDTLTDFGGGEVILDLFTYEKDGATYLLANTMRRGCVRIASAYLDRQHKLNEQAPQLMSGGRSGQGTPVSPQTVMVPAFAKARLMVKRDATHALVVLSPDGANLHLEALPLP